MTVASATAALKHGLVVSFSVLMGLCFSHASRNLAIVPVALSPSLANGEATKKQQGQPTWCALGLLTTIAVLAYERLVGDPVDEDAVSESWDPLEFFRSTNDGAQAKIAEERRRTLEIRHAHLGVLASLGMSEGMPRSTTVSTTDSCESETIARQHSCGLSDSDDDNSGTRPVSEDDEEESSDEEVDDSDEDSEEDSDDDEDDEAEKAAPVAKDSEQNKVETAIQLPKTVLVLATKKETTEISTVSFHHGNSSMSSGSLSGVSHNSDDIKPDAASFDQDDCKKSDDSYSPRRSNSARWADLAEDLFEDEDEQDMMPAQHQIPASGFYRAQTEHVSTRMSSKDVNDDRDGDCWDQRQISAQSDSAIQGGYYPCMYGGAMAVAWQPYPYSRSAAEQWRQQAQMMARQQAVAASFMMKANASEWAPWGQQAGFSGLAPGSWQNRGAAQNTASSTRSTPKEHAESSDGGRDMTLQAIMQNLQEVDAAQVVIVRKIKHLGFNSAKALRRHYSTFGKVERVLVSYSHVQSRVRPASLGFIVMGDKETADKVLAAGSEQVVGTVPITVGPFKQNAPKTLTGHEDEIQSDGFQSLLATHPSPTDSGSVAHGQMQPQTQD